MNDLCPKCGKGRIFGCYGRPSVTAFCEFNCGWEIRSTRPPMPPEQMDELLDMIVNLPYRKEHRG